MPVNGIAGAANTDPSAATGAVRQNELDKNAFLKLLIAELSNQDPLNPMEDREFIAQMAQFSSLEQMQNMNKTLESMAQASKFDAVSYIGKAISFNKVTKDAEGKEVETPTAALVRAVFFDPQKGPILDTAEGQVELAKVLGVAAP